LLVSRTIPNTYIRCVGKMQRFLMYDHVVNIITTELQNG